MNYGHRELGERLAADYVLGLMPPRARRRFEQAMARDAGLSAMVAGWSQRFAPLDAATLDEMPPARIWRAINRRVGAVAWPTGRSVEWFWRGLALTAAAAFAAILFYVAVNPTPLRRELHAFADRLGVPDLIGSAPHAMPDIGLSTMRLGVSERERPRWLRAALLLSSDALPLTRPPPSR
jgi:hypothetical protein